MIRSKRQFIRRIHFLFVPALTFGCLIELDHTKTRAADDDVVIDQKVTIQEDEKPIPQIIVIDNVNPKNAGGNVVAPGRLAVFVGAGNQHAQVVFDPKLERLIFGFDGKGRRGAWRIQEERETAIDELDRICQLTASQKHKLDLAAHGDSKRFFDRIETARLKYFRTSNQGHELDIELNELRTSMEKGILGPDSMFAKTIRNTLTKDQLATLEDPQRLLYSDGVEMMLGLIDSEVQLRAVQWNDLKDLIHLEIPRSRIFRDRQILNIRDLMDVFLYRFASLDGSKLKSLFDAKQWKKLEPDLKAYRAFQASLLEKGLILPDSEVITNALDRGAEKDSQ